MQWEVPEINSLFGFAGENVIRWHDDGSNRRVQRGSLKSGMRSVCVVNVARSETPGRSVVCRPVKPAGSLKRSSGTKLENWRCAGAANLI